jgi:hypothetical protein
LDDFFAPSFAIDDDRKMPFFFFFLRGVGVRSLPLLPLPLLLLLLILLLVALSIDEIIGMGRGFPVFLFWEMLESEHVGGSVSSSERSLLIRVEPLHFGRRVGVVVVVVVVVFVWEIRDGLLLLLLSKQLRSSELIFITPAGIVFLFLEST